MTRTALPAGLVLLAAGLAQPAQQADEDRAARAIRVRVLCESLRAWHVDFHQRRWKLDSRVLLGPDSKIRYIALAERQTLFAHRSQRTATHFTALQILLQAAEKLAEPSIVATLEMVLGPAVVGKHPGRAKAMVEVDEVFFMSDGEPSVGEL